MGIKVICIYIQWYGFCDIVAFVMMQFFPFFSSLVCMHALIPQYVQVSGIGTWVMRFRDMHRAMASLS